MKGGVHNSKGAKRPKGGARNGSLGAIQAFGCHIGLWVLYRFLGAKKDFGCHRGLWVPYRTFGAIQWNLYRISVESQ